MTQPMMTLNDGNRMPQLGTGIFQIDNDKTPEVVAAALRTGYRLIDGAAAYKNEVGMGEGIRNSDVPRDQIFVTSKLWNDSHGHDEALRAFDATMERSGLDYLDLYLIHWPLPKLDRYVETWKALIRLRDEGRIRSIGVANFHEAHLRRIVDETGVTPALNQIELHPSLTQAEMRAVNRRFGIITQSWTPLGRGDSFEAEPIKEAAERTGRSVAQVIVRWHLQHGLSVIPKSEHEKRLAENFDVLDFELTADEMAAIDRLDNDHRTGPHPDEFDYREQL
ncbi:aldo/keto reductase [Paracoccus sp. 1_MG-2023]|uniref:aldo/keto reductase n=1 Tax=unclassified Paracoccus (in: a-proteobacteria) TaxID=2688777 RepID=UPI001C091063|nr:MULTISPECIES: aldo/keto reductase [unclassified Paracoccus (in: a-proteobacteria)]MBU2956848.1 aldo/keto reductase [Paracoccus sp. C2R09]MDO6670233.1 aldo/keto reductase [Paracoccus sp. 1_MG-2023]